MYKDGDLEDPLKGRGSNVAKQLISRNIIGGVSDPELKSYLIGSQKFNSQKYLTTVHRDTSIDELTSSLGFLEQSIQSQTNELKGVIDANFIKFINCKKAIDTVLVDFKNSKTRAQQDRENATVFNPQRHRNTAKQETLSSELEEAVKNLNMATALMIRPIQENKNRENKLNKLIEFVKAHPFFFDLPNKLLKYLSIHDHDSFIDDYNKYLGEKESMLNLNKSKYNADLARLTKEKDEEGIRNLDQEYQLYNTALSKVFEEIDSITEQFRAKTYKELLSMDYEVPLNGRSKSTSTSKFTSLVDKLYKLDSSMSLSDNNPISKFLSTQLESINTELEHQIAKYDTRFRMMQRKLQDYISTLADARKNGSHVRYISEKYNSTKTDLMVSKTKSNEEKEKLVFDVFDSGDNLDLSLVNETWLVLLNLMNFLEDLFSKNLTKFVNNYRHYYQFNVDPQGTIRDSFVNIVNKVALVLVTLFENESSAEASQLEAQPKDYELFLPHYANSMSSVFYLSSVNQKLNHLFTHLGELSGLVGNTSKFAETNKLLKNLKNASVKTNQKMIEAICSVWVNDCSQLFELEDWTVSTLNEDTVKKQGDGSTYTKLMNIIEYYQLFILIKLADLTFNKDETNGDFRIVQSYPSKRMLVSIEIQFMRSLNIIVDSVMKKYNMERMNDSDFVVSDNETYKVLTMNNFDKLSRITYPRLIKKFDQLFSKDLSTQKLKLFADIDKASFTIFEDVLNREKMWIANQVNKFFHSHISNVDGRVTELRIDGFIYEILIHFVRLINKVKPVTGKDIFINIINELQSNLLKNILDNLRMCDTFSSLSMINLKLDVNFILEIFENSKTLKFNDSTYKLLQVLLNAIEEKYNGAEERYNYSQSDFAYILNQNLANSANEFDCF
ncbi:predicted protein [Scheffersomyces stipitis CBS 6054]|uniref:Exocyst complex component SEC5 n=1 Tax=Scheffersomyces stipitis (strain ATCC 58785 / CBS 6054 / NBRC 10063 / NRRL Y-11545) TaxID=322104 RepID=A3LXM7_PICST|nr:predicted protein [Scheffersomyces stipitis CBS 6054]ABN67827.2 predicted protein [Scheffersomyces stipitis CBS 6054]